MGNHKKANVSCTRYVLAGKNVQFSSWCSKDILSRFGMLQRNKVHTNTFGYVCMVCGLYNNLLNSS